VEHFWTDFLGNKHVTRHGWKLVKGDKGDVDGDGIPEFYWKCQKDGKFPDVLPEETLGKWERMLLQVQKPEVDLASVPEGWLYTPPPSSE